jgi:hypothetical protein
MRLLKLIYYASLAWLAFVLLLCLILWITSGFDAYNSAINTYGYEWYTYAAMGMVLVRFIGSFFVKAKTSQASEYHLN